MPKGLTGPSVAEGMQRATLAALCSRTPTSTGGTLVTGDYIREVYESVMAGTLGARTGARDLALRALRKAGLIEYAGTPKRWRVVESSDA